jgi:hypothetical protein
VRPAPKRLAARRVALIHVAKSRIGLDDESYRDLLWRVARVRSSTALDDCAFQAVMREFERLGFRSDFAAANLGNRRAAGMATPPQVAYIRELWGRFTDGDGTDKGLDTWLNRRFRIGGLRMADRETARKAIGALTKMVARKGG